MKLRAKKSEYQRCFASPSKDYFKSVYEEQLTYRLQRREKENGHILLRWDSDSSNESSDNQSEELQENTANENDVCERLNGDVKDETCDNDSKPSTANISAETTDENKNTVKRNPRAASTTRGKNQSRDGSREKPPFVSYGWADRQVETGRKRTHNIQAPKKSVYPAALKRLNYVNSEKIKQKEKAESRASSALSMSIFQKKQSDSSVWQSEYQRCYSSQSSRPNTAQTRKKKTTCKSRSSLTARRRQHH